MTRVSWTGLARMPQLQGLLDLLRDASGLPVAIVDETAEVQAQSGWETAGLSYRQAQALAPGTPALGQSAGDGLEPRTLSDHGLYRLATPLRVGGSGLGTLVVGPFAREGEDPDTDQLRARAAEQGLSEAELLAWLRALPVVSPDRLAALTQRCGDFARLLTSLAGFGSEGHAGEERFRAAAALQTAYQFSAEIISNANAGVVVLDADLRFVVWNPFMASYFGVPAAEVLGKSALATSSDFGEQGVDRLLHQALAGETGQSGDLRFVTPDGCERFFVGTYAPQRGARGEVVGVIGTVLDVTERRRAEAARRREASEKAAIIEGVGNVLIEYVDPDLKVVWANRALVEAFPDLLHSDRPCYETVHGRGRPCPACVVRQALATGQPAEGEATTPDGRSYLLRGSPVLSADGAVEGVLHVAVEVTESRRVQEELRQSEATAWALLNATHEMAALVDGDFTMLAANGALAADLGCPVSALAGTSALADLPADLAASRRAHLEAALRTGQPQRFEDEHNGRHLTHSIYPIQDANGQAARIAVFTRDLTYRLRAEESQRLAALGQLAGGVAHEFNNLLCNLWVQADLACAKGNLADHEGFCELAREAARRGGAICEDLMSFARPSPPQRQPLAPDRPLEAALTVAARQLANAEVTVQRQYCRGGALINADGGQLEQVYLNLVLNSCQAMPRGGTLTVATECEGTPEGPQVVVRVTDTGEGIAPEHLPHIFEPFFTTRGGLTEGETPATGLGLAVSHGLVTAQGGTIAARSEWGVGTTLELRFPALLAVGQPAEPASAGVPEYGGWVGRGLRVLVAEDQDDLREAICQGLLDLGLEIVATASGGEATAALERDRFDLVITDLLMPGGGGTQVLSAASALPEAPRVLVITGKAARGLEAELIAAGARAVLRKPFGIEAMVRAVGEVLREP
jgi:PAS domain S-box-containing protein